MISLIGFLFLIGLLAACAGAPNQTQAETIQNSTDDSIENDTETADVSSSESVSENRQEMAQTGYTAAVPSAYRTGAEKTGSVTRIDYQSRDYVRNGAEISKTAYVYTPYGYDESDEKTRYNIIYLMHGWGGHAGEYFDYTTTKNVFDHMIENGDIPPVIIVSATFYNENSNTDFSGSIAELRQFH